MAMAQVLDPSAAGLVTSDAELASFCVSLKEQSSKTQEEAIGAMVLVFRSQHALLRLASFMAANAVSECGTVEQLLLYDTLYKRCLAACVRSMITQGFLQDSLSPVLSEVCVFELMLDPSRAEPGQEHTVVDRLYRTLATVMDAVSKQAARFPVDAAEALAALRETVMKKYGQAAQHFPLCERFVFGLITSLVSSPFPLIVDKAPATNAHRSLIAVAKVLQATSSHVESVGDPFLLVVNGFLGNNVDRAVQFVKRLLPTAAVATSPRSGGSPGFNHAANAADMNANDWGVLERLANSVDTFPKGMAKEMLVSYLTAPGGTALRTLCASIVKKEDVTLFVPCLFKLFRSQGLEELLVTWAINEHIASMSESDPSFFGVHGKRTIPLMIVDFFVDRDGSAFVRLSERELLGKFLEDARVERFDIGVPDRAVALAASKQVVGLCQSVLDRFISGSESMDAALASCCHKVVHATQLKHKGKEMLAVASFMFGNLLNRSLQFPRRYGMVSSDPSAAHMRVLANVRIAFVHLIDTFAMIGGGDAQSLSLTKFVIANVPRVISFTETALSRRGQHGEPSRIAIVPKDLLDAQVVIHGIRNPGAAKKGSPEALRKTKSAATITSPRGDKQDKEGKDKSSTMRGVKGLFGKKSPRGDAKDDKPAPRAASPPPSKKSEMPAELAALAAAAQANRGKSLPVAEAQALRSPRSATITAEAERAPAPAAEKIAIPQSKAKTEPAKVAEPAKAEPLSPARAEAKPEPKAVPRVELKPEPIPDTKTAGNGSKIRSEPKAGKVLPQAPDAAAAAPPPSLTASGSLQMSIPEYGLGIEQFALPEWKQGDMVCAQWDEDRCWYKARIDARIDEDHYQVTFVEYGNTCICDNATQIVELPEEEQQQETAEKILSEVFDAEALVREMSGQFGKAPDAVQLEKDIDDKDTMSMAEVVDEAGEKLMTEVDLLAALDFSLAGGGGGATTNLKATKPDPKREAEEKKRKEAEQKKKEALEIKAKDAAEEKKATPLPLSPKPRVSGRPAEAASPAVTHKAAAAGPDEPASLADFLGSIGLSEALPLFEERKLTWTSVKLAEEDDLKEFGIPKKIMQKVVDALRAIPSTAIAKAVAAGSVEMDYEKMAVLPPLPSEPPDMANKAEYKNYMRLRYEHQKRQAAVDKVVSPITSPDAERKADADKKTAGALSRQSGDSKKGRLGIIGRSKSKESLSNVAVSKKASPAVSVEEPLVRLERYDVLLDDELPLLPESAPPIANKAEYKQYMVLRYEYERRGLLQPAVELGLSISSVIETRVGSNSAIENSKPKSASLIEESRQPKKEHVDDFDPTLPDELDEHPIVESKPLSKVAKKVEEAKEKPDLPAAAKKSPEPERKPLVVVPVESKKKAAEKTPEPESEAEEKAEESKQKVSVQKTAEPSKKTAEPKTPKRAPVGVQQSKDDAPKQPGLRYREGDKIEAKWVEDGAWYAATVSQLDAESPGGPFVLVVFDEFGNDQVCELTGVRTRQKGRLFELGDVCECRWVEDDAFYKSKVLEAGTIQKGVYTYTVEFLEYGNQQNCTEDYLRPLPEHSCRVCESFLRPGSQECLRCGMRLGTRLSTMLDELDAGMEDLTATDASQIDGEENKKRDHRLTQMFEGIDAEMEELETLAADKDKKRADEEQAKRFAEFEAENERVAEEEAEAAKREADEVAAVSEERVEEVVPLKKDERKNRSLTQMFSSMDAKLNLQDRSGKEADSEADAVASALEDDLPPVEADEPEEELGLPQTVEEPAVLEEPEADSGMRSAVESRPDSPMFEHEEQPVVEPEEQPAVEPQPEEQPVVEPEVVEPEEQPVVEPEEQPVIEPEVGAEVPSDEQQEPVAEPEEQPLPEPEKKEAPKADEGASLALLKAKKIQERLAQQKRSEEEAKLSQQASEEYARQERLRKREQSRKGSVPSAVATTAAAVVTEEGADTRSRTSSSAEKPKSRASEILERAKALTAKSKGMAEEAAAVSAAAGAGTAAAAASPALPAAPVAKKALPPQPPGAPVRESKRSSLILEQARAARAIALGGAVAGRGRGLPTPPPKSGAIAAPSVAAAGAGGGVAVARSAPAASSDLTRSSVSPAVTAALEKARKARNRLSVAKSLPGSGRGEGGVTKVVDSSARDSSSRDSGADVEVVAPEAVGADAEEVAEVVPPKAMPKPPSPRPPIGAKALPVGPATGTGSGTSPRQESPPVSPKPNSKPRPALPVAKAEAIVADEEKASEVVAAASEVACPACNAAQIPGYAFCDECGAASVKIETPEQRTRKATVRAMLAQKAAAKLAGSGETKSPGLPLKTSAGAVKKTAPAESVEEDLT